MSNSYRLVHPYVVSRVWAILFAAVMLHMASLAQAEVRLTSIFGDRMVLQQDKPVQVWGWANPGQTLTPHNSTGSYHVDKNPPIVE